MVRDIVDPEFAAAYMRGYKMGQKDAKEEIIKIINNWNGEEKPKQKPKNPCDDYGDGAEAYDGWGDWPGRED